METTSLYREKVEGKTALVCRTGIDLRLFRQLNMPQLKKENALIWEKEKLTSWHLSETFAHQGIQHFRGFPWGENGAPEGQIELINTQNPSREECRLLHGFFQVLGVKAIPWESFFSRGIIRWGEALLVLPPTLYGFLQTNRPDNDPLADEDARLNHPDLKGPEAAGFTLAVLAYRALTGANPFTGKNADEIRDAVRTTEPPLAHQINPRLREELSLFLHRWLSPRETAPEFSEWQSILDQWEKEGAEDAGLTDEAIALREKEGQKERLRESRKQKCRLFFRNHRTKLIIGSAFLVPLLVLLFNPFAAKHIPANTGLTSFEVTQLYYDCFNTLNEPVMREITHKSNGTRDIEVMTQLFVTDKVRMSYEGSSGTIRADDWVNRGKPDIPYPLNIFGVSDLTIQKIAEGDETAEYRAEYSYWTPQSGNFGLDYKGMSYYNGENRVDRIHLIKKKNRWFVDQIERQSQSIPTRQVPREYQ